MFRRSAKRRPSRTAAFLTKFSTRLATCTTLATFVAMAGSAGSAAKSAFAAERASAKKPTKPWCAPETTELSDHVCFVEGATPTDGRRTLVVYLHGALSARPGFQYLQQRAMADHARRLGFTVLMPTAPETSGFYFWPTTDASRKEQEPGILESLRQSRAALEARVGHRFDEVFIVGFSSGSYYASSLAMRGVLDVNGYVVLAGGAATVRKENASLRRPPVFVGVSSADSLTREGARGLGDTLASIGWPSKTQSRVTGHFIDRKLIEDGMNWLRARTDIPNRAIASQ